MALRAKPEDALFNLWLRLTRRRVVGGLGVGMAVGATYMAGTFCGALKTAKRRVSDNSAIVHTQFGNLEYAIAGQGADLMMLHGTGGGFDQGLLFSDALLQHGHRIIAPSRFGYLRSDYPPDPSSENQADALVELLDHLGIDKLPVAGGSAGALSATQFALRHPGRCSGLILLVPACNVSGEDPVVLTSLQKFLVDRFVTSDFWYWLAMRFTPDQLIGTLLATDPELLETVSNKEQQRAYAILEGMMPISSRSRGMLNDGRLAGRPARIDFTKVDVPALIISVEDDRFGTARTARAIAGDIREAELVIYPNGGHIWLGHDDALAGEIAKFAKRNMASVT